MHKDYENSLTIINDQLKTTQALQAHLEPLETVEDRSMTLQLESDVLKEQLMNYSIALNKLVIESDRHDPPMSGSDPIVPRKFLLES